MTHIEERLTAIANTLETHSELLTERRNIADASVSIGKAAEELRKLAKQHSEQIADMSELCLTDSELKAQVEQLKGLNSDLGSQLSEAADRVDMNINEKHKAFERLNALLGQVELLQSRLMEISHKNPEIEMPAFMRTGQYLAEIKAQAVEDAIHSTKQSFDGLGPKWFCKVENLEMYVNQIRQQAKAGEL